MSILLDGFRDQHPDRRFIADVGHRARNRIVAVGEGDRVRQLRAIGDVGNHQPRALCGERQRIMPADTLGAAGDDSDPAVQPPHDGNLPFPNLVAP